ncbi:hypothetical protein BGZ76_010300 [Entomortierella beljakovae]|nr:hypothetical protein BGZ76_010300 [Entomortierella beljakovae]
MTLLRTALTAAPVCTQAPTTSTRTGPSSSLRLSLPTLFTLSLLCSTTLFNTSTAISFEPVVYPSTAIISSKLYIYGGLNDLSSPTSYTSQFATVSLKDDFNSKDIPWDFLPSNIPTAFAPGASNSNRDRFIVGGSRNNIGHAPAMIYNIPDGEWSQSPDLVPRQGEADIMNNYHLDSPGMAFDFNSSVLVQFGGGNATSITNELLLLNISKETNEPSWTFTGVVDSIPPLYAPTVLDIPKIEQIVVLGGCDQMNVTLVGGRPSHCASFDTLYSLSHESIGNASTVPPSASILRANGDIPPPRFMPCMVVLSHGDIFMMGGSGGVHFDTPMADAWILDILNWTWAKYSIKGLPAEGIMGHNCHLASRDQILVVGGQNNAGFVSHPISVINVEDWSWSNDFNAPDKVSSGVKVGLAISVIIVVGAIVAGLWVRHRRTKAALKEAQGQATKPKPKTRRSRRSRRPSTNQSQSPPNQEGHLYDLEAAASQDMMELEGMSYSRHVECNDQDHKRGRQRGRSDEDNGRQLTVGHVAGSPEGSFSSTIVGHSPQQQENEYSTTWQDQDAQTNERGEGDRQDNKQ